MFPFEIDDEKEILLDDMGEIEPKEYEINYVTGQLTGRVVTGLDAIKAWAWLALKTDRYKYQQYSWDYGNEFETLIGQSLSQDYAETELERMIVECLTVNPYIIGIEDLECSLEEEKVTAKFTIVTDYGVGEMNV